MFMMITDRIPLLFGIAALSPHSLGRDNRR
jgi:hypothetical protein